MVLNIHRNHKAYIRDEGKVVWRWGREIIYLSLHCHHQNDFCIKMGWAVMRAILMFHNCEGQSQDSVHTPQPLKWKESWSRLEPRSLCLLAYHLTTRPNRLTFICLMKNSLIIAPCLARALGQLQRPTDAHIQSCMHTIACIHAYPIHTVKAWWKRKEPTTNQYVFFQIHKNTLNLHLNIVGSRANRLRLHTSCLGVCSLSALLTRSQGTPAVWVYAVYLPSWPVVKAHQLFGCMQSICPPDP